MGTSFYLSLDEMVLTPGAAEIHFPQLDSKAREGQWKQKYNRQQLQ